MILSKFLSNANKLIPYPDNSLIWYYAYFIINNFNQNPKITSNLISGIHALTTTCLSGYHLYNKNSDITSLRKFSTSYFIYDTLRILLNKPNKMNLVFVLHHIICLICWNFSKQEKMKRLILSVFYWGEISNLPSYPIYHLLHTNKQSPLILKLRIFQAIFYSSIRIWSIRIFQYYPYKGKFSLIHSAFIVYFMSLVWVVKLWKQLFVLYKGK